MMQQSRRIEEHIGNNKDKGEDKNWVSKQAYKLMGSGTFGASSIGKMMKITLRQKAKNIRKAGHEVTLERLMDKWEALKALGYTEGSVRAACDEVIAELNGNENSNENGNELEGEPTARDE